MKLTVTYVIELNDRHGDQSLAVLHAAEETIQNHPGVESLECLDTKTED